MKEREGWMLLGRTANKWYQDKVPQLGAALAFYTAFSIAPLLVISLSLASLIFGEEAARGEIQSQIQSLVGNQGAEAVEEMIANANKPTSGIVATTLSIVTLLFGATGVF